MADRALYYVLPLFVFGLMACGSDRLAVDVAQEPTEAVWTCANSHTLEPWTVADARAAGPNFGASQPETVVTWLAKLADPFTGDLTAESSKPTGIVDQSMSEAFVTLESEISQGIVQGTPNDGHVTYQGSRASISIRELDDRWFVSEYSYALPQSMCDVDD